MLTVYFGNDTIHVRAQAMSRLRALEETGAPVERITADEYIPGMVEQAATATSLFSGTRAVLLDTLSENAAAYEEFIRSVPALAASEHTFVCIEENISTEHKKQFIKEGVECLEMNGGKIEPFNVFGLADALVRRDKRTLWLLLQKAKREGVEAEHSIGTLFWQLKLLRLAEKTATPEEAGQKPFPYNKAKRALGNFKKGELETLSESLLGAYHDGHTGVRDISHALERWVLEL